MSLTTLAMFIYTVLLKPPPLRWIADRVLLLIIPKQVRIPEGTLTLHPHDPVISGALALGVYETYQLDVFRSVVQSGMTVLDIGANIGIYTVIAAQKVGESGRVYAFEPEQENFHLLQQNITNNLFLNTEAIQVAVADAHGELTLHVAKSNKGQHSLLSLPDAEGEQRVQTISIDAWAHGKKIPKIDVIKIDIQGAESLAFAGMQETLATRPVLLMEYEPRFIRESGNDPLAMLEMLLAFGYTLYDIDEGTKHIEKIENTETFTSALRDGKYANLLCR